MAFSVVAEDSSFTPCPGSRGLQVQVARWVMGRPSQRPGPFLRSLRRLRQLASEPHALSRVRPGLGPCLRLQVARSRWVPGRRRPSQRSGPFLWSLAPEAACQCARPGPQYLWSLSPESVRASEPSLKCLAAESAFIVIPPADRQRSLPRVAEIRVSLGPVTLQQSQCLWYEPP